MSWDRIHRLEAELVSSNARVAQLEAQLAVAGLTTTVPDRTHDKLRAAVARIHDLGDEVEELEADLHTMRELLAGVVDERDRARATAVRLEQELAHVEEAARG